MIDDTSREAFENYWYNLEPVGEQDVGKDYAFDIWQAAIAHARAETAVVLPKKRDPMTTIDMAEEWRKRGVNDAIDEIKCLNAHNKQIVWKEAE